MTAACRTLIVDDEPDMLALVSLEIELSDGCGLVVAGTASSGEEAIRTLAETRPDVIVLDYLMPDANGLEVAEKILEADPDQNIVLFSAFITDRTVAEALRIGIRECVLKDRVKALPGIIRKYCPAG